LDDSGPEYLKISFTKSLKSYGLRSTRLYLEVKRASSLSAKNSINKKHLQTKTVVDVKETLEKFM